MEPALLRVFPGLLCVSLGATSLPRSIVLQSIVVKAAM